MVWDAVFFSLIGLGEVWPLKGGGRVVGSSEEIIRMSFAMEFDSHHGDTNIGEFRTGSAYRVTYDNNPVVVKVGNIKRDTVLEAEMLNEERIFGKLKEHNIQGDIVPELIYAGPMIGERRAIATRD
jgi:hypothetical protein